MYSIALIFIAIFLLSGILVCVWGIGRAIAPIVLMLGIAFVLYHYDINIWVAACAGLDFVYDKVSALIFSFNTN